MRATGTTFEMGLREYARTPVLLALLVFLPAYLVGVFTFVAPDSQVLVELPGGGTVETTLTEVFPAFTTPMAAALLAGVAGLFLMQSSVAADSRLVTAGYRARDVVLARLGLLLAVSAIGTLAAVGVMRLTFAPEHPLWFGTAVFLGALIYGLVGVLAGVLLDRLPGVYLVMFGSMIDLFLFQNPLATDAPTAAAFMPGHYPVTLAVEAGFGDAVDAGPLVGSLAVVGVLGVLAVGAFYRSMRA